MPKTLYDPFSVRLRVPIEWVFNVIVHTPLPALGTPPRLVVIPIGGDKVQELFVGHRITIDEEFLHIDGVLGTLIVERVRRVVTPHEKEAGGNTDHIIV